MLGSAVALTQVVLVIDDDVRVCRLIKTILEPLGLQIVLAHDGRTGLEQMLASS